MVELNMNTKMTDDELEERYLKLLGKRPDPIDNSDLLQRNKEADFANVLSQSANMFGGKFAPKQDLTGYAEGVKSNNMQKIAERLRAQQAEQEGIGTDRKIYEALMGQRQKAKESEMRAEDRRTAAEDRDLQRQELRNYRNQSLGLQKEKVDATNQVKMDLAAEKQVQSLGKDLKEPNEMLRAIDRLEDAVGFALETYDPDTNKAGDQNVDLPGASVPGVGRFSFYNAGARDLQAKMAEIFNTKLHDRSGAAVTNNELERLRDEFGSGKFNTERDLLKAMKEYKAALQDAAQDVQAKYPGAAVQTYSGRGGQTLQKPQPGPVGPRGGMIKVVSPTGQTGSIPAEDWADAQAEGYRKAE